MKKGRGAPEPRDLSKTLKSRNVEDLLHAQGAYHSNPFTMQRII
jgi:hypothetical protein